MSHSHLLSGVHCRALGLGGKDGHTNRIRGNRGHRRPRLRRRLDFGREHVEFVFFIEAPIELPVPVSLPVKAKVAACDIYGR